MQEEKSFIEVQFPISKLSKESYKERKAASGQTLTGLGKWWGRKPLILVRATILGMLMPASGDPKKDREIFLRILTMDEEGLWSRIIKTLPAKLVFDCLPNDQRGQYFDAPAQYRIGLSPTRKIEAQQAAFQRMTYDEKLNHCCRPEQSEGPSEAAWGGINSHLGTSASCIEELITQLGKKRIGRTPYVGDAFVGGGSIPFEAARIGCDTYASDLNPVAALLTWGALNIVGATEENEEIEEAQAIVCAKVAKQIDEWGVERNREGWLADAFLYCQETTCPECAWTIPLSSAWVIAEKYRTVATLSPDEAAKRFQINIISGASSEQIEMARIGTVQNSEVVCPHCRQCTPVSTIRGDGLQNGRLLRDWDQSEIEARQTDVFRDRLFCIRWDLPDHVEDQFGDQRLYLSPTEDDIQREAEVASLVRQHLGEWQAAGFLPTMSIEAGDETARLARERGWTHWIHLYSPRQLLCNGIFLKFSMEGNFSRKAKTGLLLSLGGLLDYNSKLSQWSFRMAAFGGAGGVDHTFANQALNTMFNTAARGSKLAAKVFCKRTKHAPIHGKATVLTSDIQDINLSPPVDFWITDPPYADAVNYHELSEYFLSWYQGSLSALFPEWHNDSRRALAVKGSNHQFRLTMAAGYKRLVANMTEHGMQIVMFTHQDASVWADLALILWAAGLRVCSAWTIATETASALKTGNYVQGTVILVLRKQMSDDVGFLDEITHDIKPEVERQIESMMALDDAEDPNFSDSDYQLAAYAAALRVLTQYQRIEDIDVERELTRERARGEESPIKRLIDEAVKIASNYMIPKALNDSDARRRDIWRDLSGEERFYIKGLEVEGHGEARQGVYQEFARGFGIADYKPMLESGKANQTRLKTATEFKGRNLGGEGFGATLMRQVLAAVREVSESGSVTPAMAWLRDRNNVPDYWRSRETIVDLLTYLTKLPMEHWQEDAASARLLAGAVINDHAM
jgi:putative DNA methylase